MGICAVLMGRCSQSDAQPYAGEGSAWWWLQNRLELDDEGVCRTLSEPHGASLPKFWNSRSANSGMLRLSTTFGLIDRTLWRQGEGWVAPLRDRGQEETGWCQPAVERGDWVEE